MSAKTDKGQIVHIDYTGGTELPAVHANQVIIQHTESEFIVSFFEVLPPVLSPDVSRRTKEMERIKSIRAQPVARIVMAPDRAREFIAAFIENLRSFEEHTQQAAEEEEVS